MQTTVSPHAFRFRHIRKQLSKPSQASETGTLFQWQLHLKVSQRDSFVNKSTSSQTRAQTTKRSGCCVHEHTDTHTRSLCPTPAAGCLWALRWRPGISAPHSPRVPRRSSSKHKLAQKRDGERMGPASAALLHGKTQEAGSKEFHIVATMLIGLSEQPQG